MADSSGNSNNGTISGATWTTQGKYGAGLSFDGVNDFVTVADSASLDLTTAMTLEAWVYPTVASDWRTVFLKERPGDLVYGLYTSNGSNVPTAIVYVGTTKRYLSGPTTLPLNTWSHLAVTYSNLQYRLYLNGIQVASAAPTGPIVTSTGVLRLGGNMLWGEYFQGRIDEARIYNRELSVQEIQADMGVPIP